MDYASVLALKQELAGEISLAESAAIAGVAMERAAGALGTVAARRIWRELSDGSVLETRLLEVAPRGTPLARARALAVAAASPTLALGVAPGLGRRDYRLGARVQGRGPAARRLAASIEQRARGECDVRVVPRIAARRRPTWFRARRRPLEAGLSIGLAAHRDAGTLGFVVEDDDGYYLLSNNHVLADGNRARPGDPVVQPGGYDLRPSARTLVGYLHRYVPLSFSRANRVDGALASLLPDLDFYAGWLESLRDRVLGTRAVDRSDLDAPVTKTGRTTGITRGRITQVQVDTLRIDMGRRRTARFMDQFEVTGDDGRPFTADGDSGALVVGRDRRALGLFFCGGPDEQGVDLSYANPIDAVLGALQVRLTTR